MSRDSAAVAMYSSQTPAATATAIDKAGTRMAHLTASRPTDRKSSVEPATNRTPGQWPRSQASDHRYDPFSEIAQLVRNRTP